MEPDDELLEELLDEELLDEELLEELLEPPEELLEEAVDLSPPHATNPDIPTAQHRSINDRNNPESAGLLDMTPFPFQFYGVNNVNSTRHQIEPIG